MVTKLKNRLYQFLRWSEKYTKTDMVYLVEGGFWLTFGQLISSLSVFALAIAFANLIPPETYGTYKYVLSVASLFAIFSLPGMNTAIARASAQGNESTIHPATRERVLFSFIGSILALLGSGYYFLNDNIELSLALLIIAATLPLFDTFTLYNAYFTGKRLFKKQTIYHIYAQVISIAFLITTLFLTKSIPIILLAYFVPLSITRVVIYKITTSRLSRELPDKKTISYGRHLSFIHILDVISSNVDKILLWKFLGPVQLAVYAFAIAIPEQLKGPLKGVGNLAFPKFASQTPNQIKTSLPALWRKIILYTMVLAVITLLYIAVAPFIFKIFFPQYLDSIIYSQIFALSIVLGSSIIPTSLLEAQRKIKAQYFINIIHPVIRVTLFVALIPPFGIWGAIGAWLLSRLLISIFIVITTLTVMKKS